MRAWIIAVVLLVLGALTPGAFAASFDCTNAVTPFEIAICDNPALSATDDLLAKSFATAVGGLTKPALMEMRADQRQWLDFAQADCTDDAKPLTDAAYSSEQVDCLSTVFAQRSTTLEDSRMLGGLRFYLTSKYAALPDTDPDNAEYWKVASYDVSLPRIDGDDAAAKGFNAFIAQQGETLSNLLAPAGSGEDGRSTPAATAARGPMSTRFCLTGSPSRSSTTGLATAQPMAIRC